MTENFNLAESPFHWSSRHALSCLVFSFSLELWLSIISCLCGGHFFYLD